MLRLKDLAQEKRQTTIKEKLVEIEVTVTREDFPLQKSQIQIRYFPSSAQEAWEKFLSDVTKELKLDFIHSILERGDKSPIFRVIMLKNHGEYLVRQRENSAVLEVLNEGIAPMEISWEITRDIVHVKKDLEFNVRTNPITQDRVFNLVTKPITSLNQKDFVERLLKTTKPKDIVDDINKLYLPGLETWSPEYTTGMITLDYSQTHKLDKEYDMVSIHRLCLEQLDRLCSQGFEAIVAKQATHYVFKCMTDLANEPDIIALGLKLTSDLARFLLKQRDGIFTAVLNAMQHYAPVAPAHRPRKPKRLAMTVDTHELLSQHQVAPVPASYDLTGMFVDPSALENKPASRGNNNKKFAQIADNTSDNSVVDAIFAKRDSQIQHTRRTILNKPPADLFQLSRYGEFYASDKERSHLRGVTNKAIGYAQRIDFDEHSLRPITPKMRKLMEEEEKKKVQLQKEEEEKKRLREKMQKELELAENTRPKVILQQRDRVDAVVAKANLQHAKDNDAAVTLLASVSPAVIQHKQVSTHGETISKSAKNHDINSATISSSGGKIGNKNISNDQFEFASTTERNYNVEPINKNSDRNISTRNDSSSINAVENSDDDDCSSSKSRLPTIAGSSKLAPPRLMKMASVVANPTVSTLEDEEKTRKLAKNKKRVAITIHNKVTDSNSADISSGNSWSGTKGSVGKRFDPSASPPKSVSVPAKSNTANTLTKNGENNHFESKQVDNDSDDEKQHHLEGIMNDEVRDALTLPKLAPSPPPPDLDTLSITSRNSQNKSIAVSNRIDLNPNRENDSKPSEDVGVRAWVPSIATLIKRAKKVKFVKQPLPLAPRATFRAFDHQMPTNLVLTAAFAALLQILLVNYGNREWAFQHGLVAEVAEVVLDCSAMPKLFEYFVDIIEILYREGLGDPVDLTQPDDMDRMDTFDQQLDSASFLSAMVSDTGVSNTNLEGHNNNNLDNDSAANITVLDAISEMSLPTIDAEIVWSQVHDQEAARLIELSNNPKAKNKNKRSSDDAEGSDSDGEKPNDPHSDDLYQPGEILIQKITDKDSQRSLGALASNDGQEVGVNIQRPMIDLSNVENKNANNNNMDSNKNAVVDNSKNGVKPSIHTTHSSISNNNVHNAPSVHPSMMSSPATVTTGKHMQSSQHLSRLSQHSSRPSFSSTVSNISSGKRSKKKGQTDNVESGYRLYVKSTLRDRIGRNRELVQALGLSDFDARYRQVPEDSVIIALSMTMHHVEVAPRWRELAEFWLEFWADGSREYKILILKGRNLCGL